MNGRPVTEQEGRQGVRLPLRRLLAGLIDNTLILAWAGMLALVSLSTGLSAIENKAIGYPLGLFSLTLPALAYLSITEASPWRASLGKKLLGLRVVPASGKGGLARSLLRNGLKLLPWEIAHIGLWLIPGMFFAGGEPQAHSWALILTGEGLALIYLISLVIGSGRTPYDRISGTLVMKKPSGD